MAADSTKISSELTKLNKQQLIETIITGSLPKTVNNVLVMDFLKEKNTCNCPKVQENEEFVDAQDTATETAPTVLKSEVLRYKSKLEDTQRILYHVEKRVSEQEDLIALLKQKPSDTGKSPTLTTIPALVKTATQNPVTLSG